MSNPVKLAGFLGMNNRCYEYDVPVTDKGRYVTDAVNVDITAKGGFATRPGTEQVYTVDGSSLFSDSDKLWYVSNNKLYSTGLPVAPVEEAPVSGPVCWASTPLGAYFSDGTTIYSIVAGEVQRAALPTPSSPAVTELGGGNLPAGRYQVTVTYKAADGQESGAPESNNITVLADASISVTLPAVTPNATHVCVYVTPTNGTVPQLYTTVAVGTPSALINGLPTGRVVQTQYLQPLPAGSQLAYYNGHLLSVLDNFVFLSEPYNYAGYNPLKNYIGFPSAVKLVAPCDNGVYVVADQTYWLAGPNPLESELLPVFPYSGIPGTFGRIPDQPRVFWFSDRGFVIGDNQGQVMAIQAENVATPLADGGACYIKEAEGYKQLVCSLTNPVLSGRESSTWTDRHADWMGTGANDYGCWTSDFDGSTTRYVQYSFNSFASLGGVPYGMNSSGLYRLDQGTVQDSMVFFGTTDLGSSNLKRLTNVYVDGKASETIVVQVASDEGVYAYPVRRAEPTFSTMRADTGRGLRSVAYGFAVYNTPYETFEVLAIEPLVMGTTRRV